MILPFLPIFIGVAVLFGLVRTVPSGEVLPGAWLMAEFALLACLGLAARAWPVKDPRRASPFRLAAPRLIQLVLWLGVASAMDLPASLAHGCTQWLASLGGSAGPGGPGLAGGLAEAGANAAWGVLVLNLWVSDSLSVLPRQPPGSPRSGWQAGPAALWSVMRISLPMLVVVFTGMGVSMVSEGLWAPGGLEEPGISWGPKLVDLAFTLGVFTLLIPPLVRVSWGLKPLENQAAGRVIQEELAANGLHRLAVYDWPERLLVNSTAGVIGFFPRFRFMLFGGRLADSLTPEEIKAVTAHEAAHILHHHLWYTLGGLMAFVLLLEVGLEGVYSGSLFFGFGFPLWLLGVTQVAGVLLFLRFGLGALSRGFERQADGHAFSRHGVTPFRGGLLKVGVMNGIPLMENNWHHFGIYQRLDYLAGAVADPGVLTRHDRRMRAVKGGVVLFFGLALMGQWMMPQGGLAPWLADKLVSPGLSSPTPPAPGVYRQVKLLAMDGYLRGDRERAERYFRVLARWEPSNPETLNNLAWLLLTNNPDSLSRDHRRQNLTEGLRLARQAADVGREAYIWDTLTEAYRKNGMPREARHCALATLDLARQGKGLGRAPLAYYQARADQPE